jgi:hypothetical protein
MNDCDYWLLLAALLMRSEIKINLRWRQKMLFMLLRKFLSVKCEFDDVRVIDVTFNDCRKVVTFL